MSKLSVICVLWIGDFNRDYNTGDVEKLMNAVSKRLNVPYEFYCLTNVEEKMCCEKIMLKHDWPGWWSKIELYRNDLPGDRILYIDLDTYIVRNIDDLLTYTDDFVTFGSKFPKRKENREKGIICMYQMSVILYNKEKCSWVYDLFVKDYEKIMNTYRSEQDWLGDLIPDKIVFPDVWLEKLESLRKKQLNKETIFVTGHPKSGSFRNPDFVNIKKLI